MNAAIGRSEFVTAQDGLRLHVREYGSRAAAPLPAVCLPGLARTGTDFETVASALVGATGGERRVLAIDLRGRGRSEYDRNHQNYNVQVELSDVLAVLIALGIDRAVFIGTSRGGILSMLLAAARPTMIAGCVLNDIGPVIDVKGLVRIKSYVGKLPRAASIHEAAEVLRHLFGTQFPKLGDDEWVAFAQRTFKDAGGRIVPDYDPKLGKTLDGVDLERPLPTLWKEFEAMANIPLLVIRGGISDILSPETVAAMREHHPGMETIEVPDQGHAPLMTDPELVSRIVAFVRSCDR